MTVGGDRLVPEAASSRRAVAKAERRLALIESTIDSIAAHGLTGTTLARVTEMAGTSVGLANFHFDSKERLFEAVLRHLAEEGRALWQARAADASLPPAVRLRSIVDARFHPRNCSRRKLAVWFAFWGDAGARDIYRRVVGEMDDERLEALVDILETLGTETRDARQIALALEAFCDGLWLNLLLYPADFKRLACHERAIAHLAALFPEHFPALPAAASRAVAGADEGRT
jgi:TetR/AcrR family transcriptional repressor of bet genes